MDQTHKLLRSVAQNAYTGINACEQLLERTEDARMRKELDSERRQYQEFARDAEQSLSRIGGKANPPGMMQRAGMWAGMQINTMTDRSASHIADIVIQGNTMGVIEMTRERQNLPDAEEDAQSLAARFITAQQESIERLKGYL